MLARTGSEPYGNFTYLCIHLLYAKQVACYVCPLNLQQSTARDKAWLDTPSAHFWVIHVPKTHCEKPLRSVTSYVITSSTMNVLQINGCSIAITLYCHLFYNVYWQRVFLLTTALHDIFVYHTYPGIELSASSYTCELECYVECHDFAMSVAVVVDR